MKKQNKDIDLYTMHHFTPDEILFIHKGPFDKNIIAYFVERFKWIVQESSKLYKRVFATFVELAQNVAYYSDERTSLFDNKDIGIGTLVLGVTVNNYVFSLGNYVNNQSLEILLRKCEMINSMDREELREFKRNQRTLIPRTNDGAHIGLILVSLNTKQHLNVKTTRIDDDNSYFELLVEIPKKMNGSDLDN